MRANLLWGSGGGGCEAADLLDFAGGGGGDGCGGGRNDTFKVTGQ